MESSIRAPTRVNTRLKAPSTTTLQASKSTNVTVTGGSGSSSKPSSAAAPKATSGTGAKRPPPPPPTVATATSTRSRTITATSATLTAKTSLKRKASSLSQQENTSAAATSKRAKASTASGAASCAPVASGSTTAAPKKRAAWDVKGRLTDLEEILAQTTQTASQDKGHLQSMLDQAQEKIKNLQLEHNESLTSLNSKISLLQSNLDEKNRQLSVQQDECAALKSAIATQSAASLQLESQVALIKAQKETLSSSLEGANTQISTLTSNLAEQSETIANLKQKLEEAEIQRKFLHNTIQELKGNIRVFCRVRPVSSLVSTDSATATATAIDASSSSSSSSSTGNGQHLGFLKFPENDPEGKSIEIVQSSENASGSKTVTKTYPFSFDKVFKPSATQSEVFEEISQLVQSALDGYNVCIFAYGQTGSGKTFTMEGPPNATPETIGMVPRAVSQLFFAIRSLAEKGWSFTMQAQYLEIYNESLRDLLSSTTSAVSTSTAFGSTTSSTSTTTTPTTEKLDIKHSRTGSITTVVGATVVDVSDATQVEKLLKLAASNRAVAATACNERSSRSHSVFTLRISGTNSNTQETRSSNLNLIDLAGSERLALSGATGDRLKETQAINKSLSCLGDVIAALGERGSGGGHIPYRNSKLTYLLMNSLGGNCKTLMFVNVAAPCSSSISTMPVAEGGVGDGEVTLGAVGETLCSLRFATKVNSTEIGTAKKSSSATAK